MVVGALFFGGFCVGGFFGVGICLCVCVLIGFEFDCVFFTFFGIGEALLFVFVVVFEPFGYLIYLSFVAYDLGSGCGFIFVGP